MDHDDDLVPENEGVRIIGADEAAEALERDDVARRRPADAPRFGDRPSSTNAPGSRPALRFPLSADEEAVGLGEAAPVRPRPRDDDTALPHWSDPPTGEVPRIFASDDDPLGAWSPSAQPRWRGEGAGDDDHDLDFSSFRDDETRVGALDVDEGDPEAFFRFDDPEPRWEPGRGYVDEAVGEWEGEVEVEEFEEVPARSTRAISSAPSRGPVAYERPAGAGRNVPVAIGVGVAFAAVALACFAAGPKFALGLVVVVLVVAAAELFKVLRDAGYQSATLLGLAAVAGLPIAAYARGEGAMALVLFLTVAFGLLWFLSGAGGEDRPVLGLSSTLLGVGYIGVLGSFAALMLVLPTTADGVGDPGIGVLLAAILATVGYDVGGFVVGRNAGTRPLSAASPNKTVEGLIGGMAGAVVVAVVVLSLVPGIEPFSEFTHALLVGVVAAIAAPLGDLSESMLKRDLDVKDMGSVLPGHGGFLDRFDALLFVLPSIYWVARIVLY